MFVIKDLLEQSIVLDPLTYVEKHAVPRTKHDDVIIGIAVSTKYLVGNITPGRVN